MNHREFKDALYAQFARIGSALSSEKRLEIVDLLTQAPRHVESLAAETGMSVANVSQHLQVLRQARLVDSVREGTKVIYRLGDDSVLRLWLDLRGVGEERLADVRALAEAQGLAWSMTVNMKVDLAGPDRRGLALGLNEAAGYVAIAAAAFASGLIAEHYGLRPEPFYLGIGFASAGLALSVLMVKDTEPFVRLEAAASRVVNPRPLLESFKDGTWRRPDLVGLTQAGFVNNFNDGLAWGIFPLFFASQGLGIGTLGALAALYPLTWGVLQMLTGWASDVLGRLPLIAGGMLTQAGSLALIGVVDEPWLWLIGLFGLGLGTAMVYPTLLAATSDAVHPVDRAGALGVYRFWRDVGAGAGALAAGIAADLLGLASAIELVALLTLLSALAAVVLLINPRHEPRLAGRPA